MLNLRLKNDDRNMAQEELILRFFAYHDSGYKRAKNLSFFLTEFMKNHQNPPEKILKSYQLLFDNTIALVDKYLGEHAFSSFGIKTGQWTSKSNRSLYDAEMLAFADFVDKTISVTPEQFKSELEKLMANDEFRKSLHSQAGGKMIEKRVANIKKILLGTDV
jgi:hypothetical protein